MKNIEPKAFFHLSYGLYLITTRSDSKDNGCIVNTVMQMTEHPYRLIIAVNNQNYTCELMKESKLVNISTLTIHVPFSLLQRFGFQSGRNIDKFKDFEHVERLNNIYYLNKYVNSVFTGVIGEFRAYDTHTLFIVDISETKTISNEDSVTYAYYQDHIKPKASKKIGYVCTVCGYVYEGEVLPDDYVCPICKHGAEVFEKSKI